LSEYDGWGSGGTTGVFLDAGNSRTDSTPRVVGALSRRKIRGLGFPGRLRRTLLSNYRLKLNDERRYANSSYFSDSRSFFTFSRTRAAIGSVPSVRDDVDGCCPRTLVVFDVEIRTFPKRRQVPVSKACYIQTANFIELAKTPP